MDQSNTGLSRKEAKMLELVLAELDSTMEQKEWCRLHGIAPWTIRYWRRRFRKSGLLAQVRSPARSLPQPSAAMPLVFSFPDRPLPLHLAVEPVSHPSMDKCAAVVSVLLHLDPCSGDLFLFRGKDRRHLYALRWCGNGFVFFCRRLERGRFPWPRGISYDGTAGLSEAQLDELASVFEPAPRSVTPVPDPLREAAGARTGELAGVAGDRAGTAIKTCR